jgi:hypothetical protein
MKKTLRGKRYLRSRRTVEIGRERKRARRFNAIDWGAAFAKMQKALIVGFAVDWNAYFAEIQKALIFGIETIGNELQTIYKVLTAPRPSSLWGDEIGKHVGISDGLSIALREDDGHTDH